VVLLASAEEIKGTPSAVEIKPAPYCSQAWLIICGNSAPLFPRKVISLEGWHSSREPSIAIANLNTTERGERPAVANDN
jgi:hypothetical protein